MDRQVKAYEDAEKDVKKLEIEIFFQDLKSPVDLIRIWSPSWVNATTSEKQWKTELVERISNIKEKLAIIQMLNVDNPTLLTNLYLETLDFTKAQEAYNRLSVDVSEQRIEVEQVKENKPLISMQIEILATQKQVELVFKFMRDHNIQFMEGIV